MTNLSNDGTCQETSGFLFSHRCDRIAMKNCIRCGKSICQDHGHPIADGIACTTCLKSEVSTQSPSNPNDVQNAPPGTVTTPATTPTPGYRSRPYYDDPYFYGSHYYPGYGYGYGYGSSYGYYRRSRSSHDSSTSDTSNPADAAHDPNDFTEGDADSLRNEGDESFESEMGES